MDPFLEQLKQWCHEHPARAKWVFVPAHAVGHTVGERLVREGTNWLNLRFVTPLDIALRMGAPFLVERGIEPSEEALGPALMMRLLLDGPREGGYFRPLASHPTLAQALWTTVRELRMAGLTAADLRVGAFASSLKHAELVALVSQYEAFLRSQNRADMAAVYLEALAHLDWCPIQSGDLRTELPDTNWTPLQRRLIDSLPGHVERPRAYALPGVASPRRLKTHPGDRVAPDARAPLAHLMAPPAETASTYIDLFHAGGREAEIDEVFRRIFAIGAPFDTVEIACASEAQLLLIWEKAQRHDWPVTLGAGLPATLTRPGRALLSLCDWIETDFAAVHFRHLLQSGDVSVVDEHAFTASRAARVLTRAEAGWGRDTYRLSLTRLIKDFEARAADADTPEDDAGYLRTQAAEAGRIRDWIGTLVDSIPRPDEAGVVSLQAVVDAALDFLEHRVARNNALDHRAASALSDYISDLQALGAFACPLSEALRFVRERVESLAVAGERPRAGHLFAGALAQCGYAGRAHIFVVGLEEGRVFSSATEDPVLLDEERERISPALRLSTDRIDEAVHSLLSRLAVSDAAVTFSYSSRDTREFRETFASWLMLQAHRLQQGNPSLSYPDMKKALGEPASAVPASRDRALSAAGWWVRSIVGTGGDGSIAVDVTFPAIARGRSADDMRNSPDVTEFDGYVPQAGLVLDPAGTGVAYSVTELEKAAECPFRFLVKRGLGIRAVDERERSRDVWLDPLTRGSALHDVYAAMLRKTRDESRRPHESDHAWLRAYAEALLDRTQIEMPAPNAEVFERERSEFLADVALFLHQEIDDHSRRAIGLELAFGRPLGEHEEPLASSEPASLTLAPGITLRFAGRIDRVNEIGPATFEVVDYKTGGYYRNDWTGTFKGGTRLQHALYGLAVVALIKAQGRQATVTGGTYYFSSRKGGGEFRTIAAPSLSAISRVLVDLREVITSGLFLRTANERACTFCDFQTLCGPVAVQQAIAKRERPEAAALVRLGEHE
jgi:ATP-dependent helicase/nuclease subunit B